MKIKQCIISIRLNDEAFLAYRFLQEKKINPANILRERGEFGLIEKAKEYKLKLPDDDCPF